jgi:hypothetical protein
MGTTSGAEVRILFPLERWVMESNLPIRDIAIWILIWIVVTIVVTIVIASAFLRFSMLGSLLIHSASCLLFGFFF